MKSKLTGSSRQNGPEECEVPRCAIPRAIAIAADVYEVETEEEIAEPVPVYEPRELAAACRNFEAFYKLGHGESDQTMVDHSSLGVKGWADCKVRDYDVIDAQRHLREERERGKTSACWSFGDPGEASGVQAHNAQVAKLIVALGDESAGRRAIIQAVATKLGVTDPKTIERLANGTAHREELLNVPAHLRSAMCDAGLHAAMAPVNIITALEKDAVLVADDALWEDIVFEVALDSGAVVHVCGPSDSPGYDLEASPGSKRGQAFLMGDGGTIPNMGQKRLNLSDGKGKDLTSVFQIAAVTRPLMSVGKICDEGHDVIFSATTAIVRNAEGGEVCCFHRQPGGLYVAKMTLRNPLGFGRQE
jgi:hypothetical protein